MDKFVVCNIKTAEVLHFGTKRACNMSKSRNHKHRDNKDVIVTSYGDYETNVNVEVTRVNLMSNKPFQIRLRDAGGPCDPSTERYWSM